ncbi:lipase [Nesterenkonia aurantiaca]|uniref:lipase n=1 Tax=Nesterenkonia aurantiaca TaxID=1436010 RepID=UPI003EE5D074
MRISAGALAPLLLGALEHEFTDRGLLPWRLPAAARRQSTDPGVERVAAEPSGVHLDFRTEASRLALITHPTRELTGDETPHGAVYDVLVDGELYAQLSSPVQGVGTTRRSDPITGEVSSTRGGDARIELPRLPPGAHDVQIWLPHDERTELVGLESDAAVIPAGAEGRTRWLHHGSSISHGFAVSHPTGTWPVVAARAAGVQLTNLGLAGQAMLDPFTARTIRSAQADVISLKLGINITNGDTMRLRTFIPAVHGFLDTIREGPHAETPLLLVSPLHCAIQETRPGPLQMELLESGPRFSSMGDSREVASGKLTLQVIRRTMREIVQARRTEDPQLHFLDGLELFGEPDEAELPMPDQLHPDTAAQQRIATRFANVALAPGGPLNLE